MEKKNDKLIFSEKKMIYLYQRKLVSFYKIPSWGVNCND